MNMSTTTEIEREADECRREFEAWFRREYEQYQKYFPPMMKAVLISTWQAAWKAARGEA